MHNMRRRVMGSLMAVLMSTSTILGSCPAPIFAVPTTGEEVVVDSANVNANNYGLVSVTEGNILHAWDWKFTDVTKNIEDIANAGYSVVQVSPCQVCEETTKNNDWWKLYQPYDYKFGKTLGDEEKFKEMCATAEKYGISIIVDVVANHMAGTGEGTCGTRKGAVDSWWTDDKFHNTDVKFTSDFDNNREMMVRSNIGMPDIATEREDVQERMISYLETMLDMGADGFRYDAAKHIGTTSDTGSSKDTFWKNISAAVAKKRPDALVYGEILNSMPVSDKYYVNDGIKVTESQKGWHMKDALQKGGAAAAYTDNGKQVTFKDIAFTYVREASDDKLITWVENHDTYLNHWGSTGLKGNPNYMSDEQIMLGWSTVASRAEAQALFFARPDGCDVPKNDDGSVKSNPTNDDSNYIEGNLGMSTKNFDWKNQKVASVNKFKNAMIGEGEDTSVDGNCAIIKRGNKGVVITNFGNSSATISVSGLTGIKDGTYKDASGQNGEITVSGGNANISVKGTSFVVLYDESAVVKPTEAPTSTPEVTEEPTSTPEVTKEPTQTPEVTKEPTQTPVQTPTNTPSTELNVKVSVEDGKSFKTETMDVELTLENAVSGTYSVDGGPEKTFTDKVTVKVGQGKIADRDVTLKVTATGKTETVSKTYTYKKVFDKAAAAKEQTVVKVSAVKKLNSMFEVVADAAKVAADALAGEPASSYFQTNPNKQTGSKKTISSASDFTEDMIIAQGVANDSITIFRGSHEGPVYDTYAMFGAYDDKNVYIGVQYTNVIDVVDPAQQYPISDNGKPANGDIPQMFVFDTGTGDYTDGSTNDTKQKTAWDTNVKFAGDAKVDKVFLYSAKAEVNNTAFFPVTGGKVDYTKVMSSKEGTDSGITYKYEDGFFCSKMNGINGNGYNGYTPAQLNSDSGNWVDFLTTNHSKKQDTFMIMTIPMSTLGVTADQVASKGIGVMNISTFGASGIGSLPQDLSMLDVANEGYSADDSTSAEKEDTDTVTVALARLGGTASESGKKTPTPATPEVTTSATPEVTTSTTPEVTTSTTPTVSTTPEVITGASVTTTPIVVPTPTPTLMPGTPGATVTSTPETLGEVVTSMVVNFGAEKSAPQLTGNTLQLTAEGFNTTGKVTYEFAVNNNVVQAASEKATYDWFVGKAGTYTIQVTMADETGKKVVSTKTYTIEGEDVATPTPVVTATPTAIPTAVPTATPTAIPTAVPTATPTAIPTAVPTEVPVPVNISVKVKLGKVSPQKIGTSIKISATPSGGNGTYKYTYVAALKSGFTKTIAKNTTKNAVTWKPTKAGTYTVTVTATDSDGNIGSKKFTYKITSKKLAITKLKASAKKVKVKKKVKITVAGTASTGTLKFKYVLKKGKTTKVLKKYTTKKSYTWKPTKAGTYKIIVYAKDGSKKTVKKSVTITVKKK